MVVAMSTGITCSCESSIIYKIVCRSVVKTIIVFWRLFWNAQANNLRFLYIRLFCSFVFKENTEFHQRRERYLFTFWLCILGYCHTQNYLNNSILKSHHVIDFSTNICSKILSECVAYFTSAYTIMWKDFFPNTDFREFPYFDGRVVCYPNMKTIRDYLSWRQVDCKLFELQSNFS